MWLWLMLLAYLAFPGQGWMADGALGSAPATEQLADGNPFPPPPTVVQTSDGNPFPPPPRP